MKANRFRVVKRADGFLGDDFTFRYDVEVEKVSGDSIDEDKWQHLCSFNSYDLAMVQISKLEKAEKVRIYPEEVIYI